MSTKNFHKIVSALTSDAPLEKVISIRTEILHMNNPNPYVEYASELKFIDKIIEKSKKYRNRKCKSEDYDKNIHMWIVLPKGQQPVNVDDLNKKKRRYAEHKADYNLEDIRKRRFKDILHWNSSIFKKPSLYGWDGFYNWLNWFCGEERSSKGMWYHIEATQAMRDMQKMVPYYSSSYSMKHSDEIDDNTLILIKHSNKRKDYRDQKQWKEIIDFIREHNLKKIIKKIYFCCNMRHPAKIRDKEYDFIKNCECTDLGQVEAKVWSTETYCKYEYSLSGRVFKID